VEMMIYLNLGEHDRFQFYKNPFYFHFQVVAMDLPYGHNGDNLPYTKKLQLALLI
jgi:hypothetical protein